MTSKLISKHPPPAYTLLQQIGTGSYGTVYKALLNSTIYAIKIIKLEADEDLNDIINEVKFLSECSHDNIVKYYGCYMKNNVVSIMLEFCGGGSVESVYKRMGRGLSEIEIRVVLREVLLGLGYLHSVYKLHRDLKAGNILLTDQGGVKLADFGVSTTLTKTFSKRKTFIGSPYWMAPEVITAEQNNTDYDTMADIWSLGITCIEMAEMAPPLFDLHPMRVLFSIPSSPPPRLKKGSVDFMEFIDACLRKEPERRKRCDELLKLRFVAPVERGKVIVMDMLELCSRKSTKDEEEEEEEEENGDGSDSGDSEEHEDSARSDSATTATFKKSSQNSAQSEVLQNISSQATPPSAAAAAVAASTTATIKKNSQSSQQSEMLQSSSTSSPATPPASVTSAAVTTATSASNKSKQSTFSPTRVCRLARKIICIEYLTPSFLLIALDEGLFGYSTTESKLIPLSTRRYAQLNVLPTYSVLVSCSGKHQSLCLHQALVDPSKLKRRFEQETRTRKEIQAIDRYELNNDFLIVYANGAVVVYKYAGVPLNRFMKIREIGRADYCQVISKDRYIVSNSQGVSFLSGGGDNATSTTLTSYGKLLSVVELNSNVILSYNNCAIIYSAQMDEIRKVNWRYSLYQCVRYRDYIIAMSEKCIDIFNEDWKVVHVFERRDRIKDMKVYAGEKIVFIAEEEKDGVECSSVIVVDVVS